MSNLAANLIRSAERPPIGCIRLDDAELTYAQLEHASQLRSACSPSTGCIGGPSRDHGAQCASVGSAVLRRPTSRAVHPMNPLLKEREIAFCLRDSGARVIFVWDAFKEEAEAGAKLTGARQSPLTQPGSNNC